MRKLFLVAIGIEWLEPSATILWFCYGVMSLLGSPRYYQLIAPSTLLGWLIFMFSYLQDKLHIENFLITRVSVLKTWFLNARGMRGIHHRSVDSRGFMMSGGHTAMGEVYFRQAQLDEAEKEFLSEVKRGTNSACAYFRSAGFYPAMSLFDVR